MPAVGIAGGRNVIFWRRVWDILASNLSITITSTSFDVDGIAALNAPLGPATFSRSTTARSAF